ncbi:MAG TPA: hypothetical protein PLZ79_12110 [Burkholderiales bacterium]|nr:hypothetical protein [Burkholderiales bacterium]
MNAFEVRGLLQELIDENPFAIRAVLKILAVEFTDSVPTLAVTNEERPRLLINLGFVERHCRTPEQVKAALCHEFLHVLLRHTSITGPLTPARHLALDAVINAIIHRQLGARYSSLMAEYYADAKGLLHLLRPMMRDEEERCFGYGRYSARDRDLPAWWRAWVGLYQGRLVADDIEQLATDLGNSNSVPGTELPDFLLGNHADDGPLPEALEKALDRARREMNGGGIWRNAGPGANPYQILVNPKQAALADWKARTLAVLRKHLEPAPGAPRTAVPVSARLPVLSPSDRRAFLRATWSPFLPEAEWAATATRPEGRAQVYLDVSGSMNAEMPLIVALLGQLSSWIRRPFWAFSTDVVPAVIEGGVLKAGTSGGTSLACVLEHVAKTRPACAVIVTDGYVEAIAKRRVAALGRTRLHAVVTRDGNPATLRAAGIPYSQLGRLPQ